MSTAKEKKEDTPAKTEDKKDLGMTDDGRPKVEAKALSSVEMDKITKTTAQLLRAQPKMTVRIRQNPKGQTQLDPVTVQVNGHTFMIRRGEDVEVPQTVRDILVEANLI